MYIYTHLRVSITTGVVVGVPAGVITGIYLGASKEKETTGRRGKRSPSMLSSIECEPMRNLFGLADVNNDGRYVENYRFVTFT
jgi:hypothetical protein